MLYFMSDYTEGAHPKLLKKLCAENLVSMPGYGDDAACASAKEKIRAAFHRDDLQICFLTGGTQTNLVVISTMLRRYEAVVAAKTGHVSVHEAGAIEYTGHKVIELEAADGKLDAGVLAAYLETYYADANHEHMPFPGMVYISHPTEYGTLYSRAELDALSAVCRRYEIPLYLDGARLGYGLMAYDTDVGVDDIVRCCDVFYIGGTKVGALCGEALVFTRQNMPAHFLTLIKQQGALLAKGRVLGMQYDALFTDGLYWTISRHAIDMAMALKAAFREKGYPLYIDSPTNQQFVLLTDEQMARLGRDVAFSFWEKPDAEHTVVRFATSWATRPEDVEALKALL